MNGINFMRSVIDNTEKIKKQQEESLKRELTPEQKAMGIKKLSDYNLDTDSKHEPQKKDN